MRVKPKPKKIEHKIEQFGIIRNDEYSWLSDPFNPEVQALLEEERNYSKSYLSRLSDLSSEFYNAYLNRITEDYDSAPTRLREGELFFRYRKGFQYPQIILRNLTDSSERTILDLNMESQNSSSFSLGSIDVDTDEKLFAFSFDFTGSEIYQVKVLDFNSLEIVDRLENVAGNIFVSSSLGCLIYETLDATHRPYRVWRHILGSRQKDDELLYEENDGAFFVSIHENRSRDYLLISSSSITKSEIRVLKVSDLPKPTPRDLKLLVDRLQNTETTVDIFNEKVYYLTNLDGAENFKVMISEISKPELQFATEFIAHHKEKTIIDIVPLEDFVCVEYRENVTKSIKIIPNDLNAPFRLDDPVGFRLESEPESGISMSAPSRFETNTVYFGAESLISPYELFRINLVSGIDSKELVWRHPVRNYEVTNYITRRLEATSRDGKQVPITIAYKSDFEESPLPCLIYAYGAYEISSDPHFSVTLTALLDKGILFAIVHARGGGEKGRKWYLDGKLRNKKNTFYDVLDATHFLINSGYADKSRLAIRGGSAGGLTVGAVLNIEPDLFKVAIAEVPFVDCLNTITNPDLPLTITEWDEWGNPIENEDDFKNILSYAPYENVVKGQKYPKILATLGLTDPRVSYFEPMKWAYRIRDANEENLVILLFDKDEGHQGKTARYEGLQEEAQIMAFLVTELLN